MQTLIEKQALKELVDTFSNLADEKNVAAQGSLFTADGHVTTYIGGALFADLKSRAEIVQFFTDFLANFKSVYHLNGQTLIHNHYVRYNDSYVKEDGRWLIKRRIANFMISDSRKLAAV